MEEGDDVGRRTQDEFERPFSDLMPDSQPRGEECLQVMFGEEGMKLEGDRQVPEGLYS